MKKFFLAVVTVILALSFSGCAYVVPSLSGISSSVRITFVDGDVTETREFTSSSAVDYPEKNAKGNEHFSGWYYDSACTSPVMPGDSLKGELTLYAGYTVDLEAVTNKIFSSHIKANVGVEVKSVQGGFFGGSVNSSGSGAIFAEDAVYYYLLANDHVVTASPGYTVTSYKVLDCYGNEYSASLIDTSPEYDLAVMRIPKGNDELFVLDMADEPAERKDFVAAIGQPSGMKNSVTYGEVVNIKVFEGGTDTSDETSIDFPIIWHDAPVDHGSSGGMLLNSSLELVGINFAIGTSEDGGFICGFAVGIEKVKEYLSYLNMFN